MENIDNKHGLLIDVEESPKKWYQWILFAMQHVLAVLVATITIPLLIPSLPVAATMISAGIGTLFYIFVTRKKSPVFLSSSFAYIAPMSSALAVGGLTNAMGQPGNYAAVMLGMLMVGIVYTVIAIVVKFTGTGWLDKLLPPVVVGPTIMIIGLSLAISAIGNVTNVNNQYNFVAISCGLIALFVTAFCAHFGEGKMLGLIPFIIGMGSGYLAALIFTLIGYTACKNPYFAIINFEPLISIFTKENIGFASFFNYNIFVPNNKDAFVFLRWDDIAKFNWADIGQIALLFIPVSFATICEHIGDHKNLGNIIGRDLLGKEPGMTRTLIGDGVATAVSGQLAGCANTTYGESVAVIGTTKIASVNVMILAAVLMICFGLFTPFTALLQTMPACVTGGVSIVLYGFIAISGVKMLIHENIDFNKAKNLFIVSTILVAGVGGFALNFVPIMQQSNVFVEFNQANYDALIAQGVAVSRFVNAQGKEYMTYIKTMLVDYSVSISSVAVAMILGIILNVVLPEKKIKKKKELVNEKDTSK